jgi:hypothetical protein
VLCFRVFGRGNGSAAALVGAQLAPVEAIALVALGYLLPMLAEVDRKWRAEYFDLGDNVPCVR